MTVLSPLQVSVAELAAAAGVQAIVGVDPIGVRRVRPIEPAAGDSLGPGHYIAFVVVSVLDDPALPFVPVRDVTLGIRAYAATYAEAEELWLACEAVFRDRGAHRAASGLGVWFSRPRSIGPDHDPNPPNGTGQPVWHGTVRFPTTIGSV